MYNLRDLEWLLHITTLRAPVRANNITPCSAALQHYIWQVQPQAVALQLVREDLKWPIRSEYYIITIEIEIVLNKSYIGRTQMTCAWWCERLRVLVGSQEQAAVVEQVDHQDAPRTLWRSSTMTRRLSGYLLCSCCSVLREGSDEKVSNHRILP